MNYLKFATKKGLFSFLHLSLLSLLFLFFSNFSFGLTTRTWDGGGGTNDFNTAANWSGDVLPSASDSCVIIATSDKTITVSSNITIGALYLYANGANVNLYLDCVSKVITINGNLHMLANGNSNTDLKVDVGSSTGGIVVGRHAVVDDGGAYQCFFISDLTSPGKVTFKGNLTIGPHGRTLATYEPVILMDGTGAQSVVINNTDTYFLGEDVIIGSTNNPTVTLSGSGFTNGFGCYDGNVTLNGTSVFDIGTKTVDRIASAGGTFTIASSATLKIGGTADFPASYSTYTLSSTSNTRYYGTNQTVNPLTYGNVYLETSGVKTVSSASTINGSLYVDGSAYADINASLTIAGNVTISSTATGDFGAASSVGGNFTMSGTSIAYFDGAMDINGNVVIGSGTNLYGGAVTSTVAGNWTNSGTFTEETSTITFDGTGTSTVSATSSSFTTEGTTLLTESFENGGSIPSGWNSAIVVDAGADPLVSFVLASTNPIGFTATAGSYFAKFNSYTAASTGQNRLKRTTSFSTVGLTNIVVNFDWTIDDGFSTSADRVNVQYSTDGTSWTTAGSNVVRYSALGDYWTSQSVTLPAGAENQATLYIAFLFTSGYGNDCYLDNVVVTGGTTNEVYAGETFYNFKVSKTGSGSVTLASKIMIDNSLNFNGGIITSTSSYYPEFDEDATVAGTPSNTSHVNATVLKRTNSTTKFTFPVGNGTTYRYIAATPSSTNATVWTVKYNGVGHSDTDVEVTLDHILTQEYWNVDRSGASPANATLEVTWIPSTGVTDYTQLSIAHYDGTTDWDKITSTPVGTNSSGVLTSSSAVSTFSPFTIGVNAIVPLPVAFVSFDGKNEGDKNNLKWVTSSEHNNDFFTLEKSVDGKVFEEIGKVAGAGNSTQEIYYSFDDADYRNEINYYRLKQTDYDGSSVYTKTISIDNRIGNKVISKIINIHGQEVSSDYRGAVIIIYSDNTILRTVQGL